MSKTARAKEIFTPSSLDDIPALPNNMSVATLRGLATDFHCQNINEMNEESRREWDESIYATHKQATAFIKENKQFGSKYTKPVKHKQTLSYANLPDNCWGKAGVKSGLMENLIDDDCDKVEVHKNSFEATIWTIKEIA